MNTWFYRIPLKMNTRSGKTYIDVSLGLNIIILIILKTDLFYGYNKIMFDFLVIYSMFIVVPICGIYY